MDLEGIKNFIPRDGERFIFIENGKPVFVIMSFQDYERNLLNSSDRLARLPGLDNSTHSFSQDSEDNKEGNKEVNTKEADNERELKIEDLPF